MAEQKRKEYYTQTEVSELFRVTAGTVKNWRERGTLPFLQMPGSTRVLYPREAVDKIRAQFTRSGKEVEDKPKRPEITRAKPGISSTIEKWRI